MRATERMRSAPSSDWGTMVSHVKAIGLLILVALPLLLSACVPEVRSADWRMLPVIDEFSELESHVGKRVILDGVWSPEYSASGLYLKGPPRRRGQGSCVYTGAIRHWESRSRVRVAGLLERSPCADGAHICLEVCAEYVLLSGST